MDPVTIFFATLVMFITFGAGLPFLGLLIALPFAMLFNGALGGFPFPLWCFALLIWITWKVERDR